MSPNPPPRSRYKPPITVFAPAARAVPATTTEQLPPDSVQLPNAAAFVVSVNVTDPCGVAPAPVSATVAVTVLEPPGPMLAGTAPNVVVVTFAETARLPTACPLTTA